MRVVEFVKSHPYAVGAGVFVVGVIVVMSMGGTSQESVDGDVPSYNPYANSEANNVLAQMQIQAQVASRVADNDAATKQGETQAAVSIARANFDYLSNKDVLAAKTSAIGIENSTKVALSEIEGMNYRTMIETNGKVAINQANASASAAIAAGSYSRDIQVASLAAAVENNRIGATADLQKYVTDAARQVRLEEVASGERIAGATLSNQAGIANLNVANEQYLANLNANVTREKNLQDYNMGQFQQASNNILRLSGR